MKKLRSVKQITAVLAAFVLSVSCLHTGAAPVLAQEYERDTVRAEDVLQDRVGEDELFDKRAKVRLSGLYLPDVTAEMSKASFWSDKVYAPDALLADLDAIGVINQTLLDNEAATNMNDLDTWPATYNGERRNERNLAGAESDAEYCFSVGARYDLDGNYYGTYDEAREHIYAPMIDNCIEPDVTTSMPFHYAICTTRTCLLLFPSDHPLWDDYADPDFGYLWSTPVRVNEPLLLASKSADGQYYLAYSSCSSGWVSAQDIAICEDKEEWLSAWDLPPEKTLVVYEDKMYTDASNYAPHTSDRMLTMGTCLELADEEEYADNPLIINRRPYNNHVVYLPVRNEDGSYSKELALIGENRDVHEGFLPLTTANILDVALHQLGDPYGWGGMLETNDCSGYVRDVYKCFGLDLPRNTSWQAAQPTCRYDLSAMDYDEKTEFLRDMPPGTILIFKGHEMLYLGEEGGKLYVISSVSDLKPDEESGVLRVRGGLINTLDVRRGKSYNYVTWMEALHTAVIPYYPEGHVLEYEYFFMKGNGSSWVKTSKKPASFTINRTVNDASALRHLTGVIVDGKTLSQNDYSAQTGSVVLNLNAVFLRTLSAGRHTVSVHFDDGNAPEAGFTVKKAANPLKLKGRTTPVSYKKLKVKTQTLKAGSVITFVKKGKGTMSYRKTSGNKKITVNRKTGKVTVRKGLKKGTYKVTIKVKAAGNASYKASAVKKVTFRIKVR